VHLEDLPQVFFGFRENILVDEVQQRLWVKA
jgi:hypothetical protein